MAPNAQNLTRPNGSNLPRRSPKKNSGDSHDHMAAVSEEVKLLTRYVILSLLGKAVESPSRRADTLKRLVQELESDNNLFFSNVCQQLDLTTTNAHVSFNAVCDEIFTDQINWGRIVSYYAFSLKMAQFFQSQRQDWMVERVVVWAQEYIGKLEPWIHGEGGGWEEFDRQFVAEPAGAAGSLLWKGFLVTATLGLGAFVAVICRT